MSTVGAFLGVEGGFGQRSGVHFQPRLSRFLDPLSPVVNYLPQSLNLVWGPRADGTFLKAPPQQLVLQGSVADIPFVTGKKTTYPLFSLVINLATPGNCDDEGTLFSLGSFSVT